MACVCGLDTSASQPMLSARIGSKSSVIQHLNEFLIKNPLSKT